MEIWARYANIRALVVGPDQGTVAQHYIGRARCHRIGWRRAETSAHLAHLGSTGRHPVQYFGGDDRAYGDRPDLQHPEDSGQPQSYQTNFIAGSGEWNLRKRSLRGGRFEADHAHERERQRVWEDHAHHPE